MPTRTDDPATPSRRLNPSEPDSPAPSRRTVVRAAGLVALAGGGAAVLAACGAGDSATTPTTSGSSHAGSPSDPATSTAPSPSAQASASAKATLAAQPPSGPNVATADVPVGGGVIMDGADYVVTQPTKGTYKAFTKTCTHQGCPVTDVADGKIHCNCHQSYFSIKDGSVVGGPAPAPLKEYDTTVSGSKVYVAT